VTVERPVVEPVVVEPAVVEPAVEWRLSGFGDEIAADPVTQVAVLQALGANHLEVRSAWGSNVIDLAPGQLDDLADLLDTQGMGVSAIASPIGKVDVTLPVEHELERLSRAIGAAHRLGSHYIRIFSFFYGDDIEVSSIRNAVIDRMLALTELAAASDVVLLHENEKHIFGDTPERVLDLVTAVDSPALRLAWDSANFVQVGVRPFADAFPLLAPYIEYLQVKDARLADGTVVPSGEGDGDIREVVTALRAGGYRGFASLEPHLALATTTGGFSGPTAFGLAARAFARIAEEQGVRLV
jgi:sugar phosphate isomerase/epimerase